MAVLIRPKKRFVIWKKKLLLFCLQLPKLGKDDLITIANNLFSLSTDGTRDDLINTIQNHIRSEFVSLSGEEYAMEHMIGIMERELPQSVLNTIYTSAQSDEPVVYGSIVYPKPVKVGGLLSDAIRNKHKSKNNMVSTNTNSIVKSTSTKDKCEINKNPRHINMSYSFSELPFYPRTKLLSDPYISPISNQKLKKRFYLKLTKEQYRGLQNKEYKIFFFCGAIPISIDLDDSDNEDENNDYSRAKHEVLPISFPQTYQFINMWTGVSLERYSRSSKKNQRADPIDITDLLSPEQLSGTAPLQFSFHFVPSVEYYMSIYLVNAVKTDDIVSKVCQRTKILRNATLYYLNKSQDPENGLLATSITMSLECPISGSVINVPIKSTKCLHIECFDAFWYFESQRQLENGRCPICSKSIKSDDLAVSEFIEDILVKCPKNCRRVQLATDGNWEPIIDSGDDDSDMDSDDDEGYGYPPAKKQKPSPHKSNLIPPELENSILANGNINEITSENIIDTTTENVILPIIQNYFSFPTLDPGTTIKMTPTHNNIKDNLSFTSEVESNLDSPLTSQIVPNILGTTPLNKNNYKGLPTTKTFHNLAAIHSTLDEDNGTLEDPLTIPVNNPTISPSYPPINNDVPLDIEYSNMEIDNNVSIISASDSETTVLHNNLERSNLNLSNSPTSKKSRLPLLPKLPDLPTLPFKFIEEKPQNYKKPPTAATKKPVVVPFNSKFNGTNSNILPQKRQLSKNVVIIKQSMNHNLPR
ncbi:hypothetical protein MOUN0_K05226 [Monosporozyma unispora]